MRQSPHRLLILLLVGLLAASVLPSATGAEPEDAGRSAMRSPTVQFDGDWDLTVGSFAAAVAMPDARLAVHAEQAVVTVYSSEQVIAPHQNSDRNLVTFVLPRSVHSTEHHLRNATFAVRVDPGGGVVAFTGGGAHARVPHLSLSLNPETEEFHHLRGGSGSYESQGPHDHEFRVTLREGNFTSGARFPLTAPEAELIAYNATFTGAFDARVGYREDERATAARGVVRYVNESFARVHLVNVTFLGEAGPQAPRLTMGEITVAGVGRAVFAGATGWVDEAGGVDFARERVIVEGAFEAHGNAAQDPDGNGVWLLKEEGTPGDARWTLAGEFEEVTVGGATILERTAAGVALGALALATVYVLYSRIGDESVLKHPVRRAILDAVVRRPGMTLKELAGVVGASGGAFRYHVNVLKARKLVKLTRRGKYVLVHPPAEAPEPARLLPVMGKATVLVRHLSATGPATAGALAKASGLSHQLVYHHLRSLTDLGIVVKEGRYPAVFRLSAQHEADARELAPVARSARERDAS